MARVARRPFCLVFLLYCLFAQDAPNIRGAGTPAPNLLSNGGFEDGFRATDNLWDGVDSDGYLAGFRFSAQVVSERGALGALAMPPSVALVDLNGDGKPDLLVADPTGYFRFYPNHGTAAVARFTTSELLPIYLSVTFKPRNHQWSNTGADRYRYCPRFALADWRHTGLLDLLIGNYYGETLFIPNAGTATQPVFRQPSGPGGVTSARLSTSEKEPFWGNLLAPAAADFDHRGRFDLVMGEGTYSANSIHLLRNISNGGLPKFTDAQHTHIAYGDGREQLIPTVVDFDGDGNQDLLVADRTGEVGVYLNPGNAPGAGHEFKRVASLSFGQQSKLPGLCSINAADFNGDGLFDLIFGMSNGHIGVAINTGTKGRPAFGPVQEIKGEDRLGRDINLPNDWETSTFPEYGNALAYFSVVDAQEDPACQPPEGAHCLKAGYWPMPGNSFQLPPEGIPGAEKHFALSHHGVTLENNKTYELSFRVKGSGMEKLRYNFFSHYEGVPGLVKIERGERGEMKNRQDFLTEDVDIGDDFTVSPNWSTVTGTLNIHYRNPTLHDRPMLNGSIFVEGWATSLSSVIYFDDFKLVPK